MTDECRDFDEPRQVRASAVGCEDCEQTGDEWVHLRICLVCGHVGCCDNSLNRHATRHAQRTGHPIIASYEPGETWVYCYPHDRYLAEAPERFGFTRKS